MSEVNAHNAVYKAFNEADREWICAKIDADVVLNDDALITIAPKVGRNSHLTPFTHDFFTDTEISAGVSIFGYGVRFKIQTDSLKCDRDVASNEAFREKLIGRHCYYANEYTAFHYGYHRGLKSQLSIYDDLVKAYEKFNDNIRLMAIRGFDLAQSDRYKDYHLGNAPAPTDHNYGDQFEKLFKEFSGPNPPSLTKTWR